MLNYVDFYCEYFLLPNIIWHIIYDLAYGLVYDTSILGMEMPMWLVLYPCKVLGVYNKWDDRLKQVNGFNCNTYKGYKSISTGVPR
jgi:hypothetical protein